MGSAVKLRCRSPTTAGRHQSDFAGELARGIVGQVRVVTAFVDRSFIIRSFWWRVLLRYTRLPASIHRA